MKVGTLLNYLNYLVIEYVLNVKVISFQCFWFVGEKKMASIFIIIIIL